MIDSDKIGKYIKELRKNNKLTQEELADKIYVSRQAVSNWERGKDAPSVDNVKNICLLFNVSMADIYAGEEVKDIKTLNDIIHSLVTMEMKKSKKIMIVSSIIIFFLIVLFLVYYFVTYYNNITAYIIKGNTPNYDINGIMNKSVDNLYFNLSVDTNPDKFCLVYDNKELLCVTNNNYISFTEYNGYNEIISLDRNNFNEEISNMYVIVQKDGNNEKIKLDIEKDYQNSNLIKDNYLEANRDEFYKVEFKNVPDMIKDDFKYKAAENAFYLEKRQNDKSIEMQYYVEFNSFHVLEKYSDYTYKYVYDLSGDIIMSYDYVNNKDSNIIKSYTNISNNDTDSKKKEIYNYFKGNYIDKYLK